MKTIVSPTGLDRLVAAYQQHLQQDAGCAAATCRHRSFYIRGFLTSQFKPKTAPFDVSQITPDRLVRYLRAQRPQQSLATLQAQAAALRSLCRFLCLQGHPAGDLSAAIPAIAAPQEHLPRYLQPEEVQRLLHGLRGKTAAHRRNYAIVLCLARLGLRAGEVVRLRLEDLHWRTSTLGLVHTKGRRDRELPLSAELGRALADYLQHARPSTTARQVFVSLRSGQALSVNGLSALTTRALQRAGIGGPHLGARLLRHTVASQLVQRGTSLKAVADLLGHGHLSSTQVYAKVNLPLLRQVAQPWPQEVVR